METKGFIDLLHYKIGYRIYSLLGFKNHSNIILYGKEGSGKSLLIKTIITNIYSGLPTHQKNDFFSFTLHNNYYLFNCFCINDRIQFIKYIQSIVKTYDYYNDQCKYIIFDQFERLNEQLQNTLKVIIETACYTCKFIIITNKYNKVIPAIRSRCMSIRIPYPTHNDIYIYCKWLFNKEKISYHPFQLLEECKSLPLQNILYQYTYSITVNFEKKIYNHAYSLIHQPKLTQNNIIQIRKLTSEIKELNINPMDIINQLILSLKEEDPYMKVIQICNDYDHRIIFSYRELIHIESLIIYLNLIINHI
tara:strand:+ start:1834 stop:2751 length:918 start_codon:yes stop_codon:yes gene_type:complete